ncbi:hypothetical protein [Pseudomonas sp. 18173]|uniref:hypothetical protein n=1 Tax=Pseudomonas sp. 18173 TaxID=3390055 RepID=UPI003D19B96E
MNKTVMKIPLVLLTNQLKALPFSLEKSTLAALPQWMIFYCGRQQSTNGQTFELYFQQPSHMPQAAPNSRQASHCWLADAATMAVDRHDRS